MNNGWKIRRPLCLVCLVFILLVMGCVYSMPEQEESIPDEGENIVLTGIVTNKEYKTTYEGIVPVLYVDNVEICSVGADTCNIEAQKEASFDNQIEKRIAKKSGEKAKKGRSVMCYMTDVGENRKLPRIGEMIRISGEVSLFREATNPGEFDLKEYYQILDISYKVNQTKVLDRSGSCFPVKEQLFQLRMKCAAVLDKIYPAGEASVLKAMLLGDKGSLDEEIKELYQLNGLIHILSISGLHVSLLGMAIYKGMKKCYIPVWLRTPVVIGIMWCYGTMTGMGVSTWRAIFMFALHLAAELFGRTYDMLTALSLAAVLMLTEQPLLVRHSGFLLSFGAVLGIAVVLPWWKEITEGLFNSSIYIFYQVREGFILSTAIAITTLPVLLQFFYVYPVYSLLLNLYVIPLMGVVLADGMLSMGMGLFWPEIAVYLGLPDRLILRLYEYSCEGALTLPGGIRIAGQPAVWQIVIYYVILTGLIIWHEAVGSRGTVCDKEATGGKGTACDRGAIPACCQWLAILGLIQLLLLRPVTGLTAHFLDVGQGDCIVMVNENGNCYMVDGGSTSKSQVGKYQMLPFLESRGIGELEAVFLTHPDEDHISGVMELMAQSAYGVRIKSLILPDIAEKMKENELLGLRQEAAYYGIPVYYIGRGDVLTDRKLTFSCLGPEKGLMTDEVNEVSTVLYVSYKDFSMLLTGDVTGEPERELLAELEKLEKLDGPEKLEELEKLDGPEKLKKLGNPIRLTVLKAAHHGSRYSTPEELLELTRPVNAVISAGKNNRYGHPHGELLERLKACGTQIYQTAESGAVTVHVKGGRIRIEEYMARQKRELRNK